MILAVLAALAVALVRVVLYLVGSPAEGTDLLLVHCLAIVTVVFFTNKRLLESDPQTGIGELLREGFKQAAMYALLSGCFIWLHYHMIEVDHFPARVNELVALGMEEGHSEEVIRPRIERFFTPFNYASLTFFALLITGAVNALLIGILHHKVLRKVMR